MGEHYARESEILAVQMDAACIAREAAEADRERAQLLLARAKEEHGRGDRQAGCEPASPPSVELGDAGSELGNRDGLVRRAMPASPSLSDDSARRILDGAVLSAANEARDALEQLVTLLTAKEGPASPRPENADVLSVAGPSPSLPPWPKWLEARNIDRRRLEEIEHALRARDERIAQDAHRITALLEIETAGDAEIDRLRARAEKAEYSARQFCGAHVGLKFERCPVCACAEFRNRATALEAELAAAKLSATEDAVRLKEVIESRAAWRDVALKAAHPNVVAPPRKENGAPQPNAAEDVGATVASAAAPREASSAAPSTEREPAP